MITGVSGRAARLIRGRTGRASSSWPPATLWAGARECAERVRSEPVAGRRQDRARTAHAAALRCRPCRESRLPRRLRARAQQARCRHPARTRRRTPAPARTEARGQAPAAGSRWWQARRAGKPPSRGSPAPPPPPLPPLGRGCAHRFVCCYLCVRRSGGGGACFFLFGGGPFFFFWTAVFSASA